MSIITNKYRMFYERIILMENVRQYLISVTATALICSVSTVLTEKKGAFGVVVKLVSGIFLVITVISPITKIDLSGHYSGVYNFTNDAQIVVRSGVDEAQYEMSQIIKQQAEAYILDKASSMEADITASVSLNDEKMPKPDTVTITGQLSPYAKHILMQYIEENLSIPEERQIWK